MTEHYVTLFDATFLPQGLALHASLVRHAGDFELTVIAMDEQVERVLVDMALPRVRVIPLRDAETEELQRVKPSRSIAEYCWTITPFAADVVFSRTSAERVTYLDADLWFLGSPSPVFAEMESAGAAALITDHAYAPEYEHSDIYGRFCVQFMPFERSTSQVIRETWQQQCLDWCYAEPSDGRFGDQKYLDEWPGRYGTDVHVLQTVSLLQAPWNAVRFAAGDAAVFHFHRLRIVSPDRVYPGLYRLPREHIASVYRPYLRDLRAACNAMHRYGMKTPIQLDMPSGTQALKDWIAFRVHNWRSPFTPYTLTF